MNNTSDNRTVRPSVLDRSIPLLIHHRDPDDTPSRRDGVSADMERLHRMHGISLIRSAWSMLLPSADNIGSSVPASAFATASIIFHRFYHNVSLRECNVWSTAMATTLLSAKLLEVPQINLRKVIFVYAHIYRKRIVTSPPAGTDAATTIDATMFAWIGDGGSTTLQQIQAFIQPSGMSPAGPIYLEWKKSLTDAENRVLRALGFVMHWIPNQLPHKYLLSILGETVANDSDRIGLIQRSWIYCNDSFHFDLTSRVAPEVIATAAVILAETALCGSYKEPWHRHVCGKESDAQVSMVLNVILGWRSQVEANGSDVWMATRGFVKSLQPDDGSFNDPSSFIWEMTEEQM